MSLKVTRADTFPLALVGFEFLMVICYGAFVDYNDVDSTSTIDHYYPFYQDIHVMILVGFGFLMTFLRKYAYSALGYTMLLTAVVIQASILINGLFHNAFNNDWHKLELDVTSLISGDFAAGAVLISFGAILGRSTPMQLFIMSICELVFYAVNESIGVIVYEANDMGGSMYVHTFGAYFGLAVAWVLARNNEPLDEPEDSKISNTTAAIGTLFLWMFWPSFNGAFATGESQNRVIVNTVFALCASAIGAFATSKLVKKNRRFEMEHILNATLAGGVGVGSSADLIIKPFGAILIGTTAGTVSVLGYHYLSPHLEKKYGIYDTCGVHNLHGIPGVIGGLGGVISAAIATKSLYDDALMEIYPARADGRTAWEQSWYQLAALGTTIAISIIGGLLTGLIMQIDKMNGRLYDDSEYWEVAQQTDEEAVEHNVKKVEMSEL